MRALTLTQPWATLVALGAKRVETRSWGTAYRGSLAIHAAKGMDAAARAYAGTDPCRDVLCTAGYGMGGGTVDLGLLPRGAIVAVCQVVDVVHLLGAETLFAAVRNEHGGTYVWTAEELAYGDFSPGRYAWVLDEVLAVREPVPCTGALGLWRPPVQAYLAAVDTAVPVLA